MAVDILYDRDKRKAVMYCTTDDRAFGPVFDDAQSAEDFIDWLRKNPPAWSVAVPENKSDERDPRNFSPAELARLVEHWQSIQTYVGDA